MQKILIVEDDELLSLGLTHFLENKFSITRAANVAAAEYLANKQSFDMVIADVNLPDGTGLEFCGRLRTRNKGIPIIFISGADDIDLKLRAFEAGADDFIAKPFNTKELQARILARLKNAKNNVMTFGNTVRVDFDQQKAYYIGKEAEQDMFLTPIEFRLLVHFFRHPDQIITREDLLTATWGKDCHVGERTVDKHICSLRRRLQSHAGLIATIPHKGYILRTSTFAESH